MAETINDSDITNFLTNAAWAIRSTCHTVLKTSPGTAIYGWDMLFDVPYLADWTKRGEYRQQQTDKNTKRKKSASVDWDYQPGAKDGIVLKTESWYDSDP